MLSAHKTCTNFSKSTDARDCHDNVYSHERIKCLHPCTTALHQKNIANVHILTVPVYERNIAEVIFDTAGWTLGVPRVSWKEKIIGIQTGSRKKCTGHVSSIEKRFQIVGKRNLLESGALLMNTTLYSNLHISNPARRPSTSSSLLSSRMFGANSVLEWILACCLDTQVDSWAYTTVLHLLKN